MMRHGFSSADLHIHTTASDGTASPRRVLEWASRHTDLSVIAICDHNTNEGALEAAALADDYPVEVIVGQEVESEDGHILGLWTPELISPGMSAQSTVTEIHRQGGLAIIAHPFAPLWWHRHGLCRGAVSTYDSVDYDAIEIANSTPLLFLANPQARKYWRANNHRLASTGGSDAHMKSVIGSSRTLFKGHTASDLREALLKRETFGVGPTFSMLRGLSYAFKVPSIKRNDRVRKCREAERAGDVVREDSSRT